MRRFTTASSPLRPPLASRMIAITKTSYKEGGGMKLRLQNALPILSNATAESVRTRSVHFKCHRGPEKVSRYLPKLFSVATGLIVLLSSSTGIVHADPILRLAQNWDSRAYGDCINVGSDNVGPLLVNKCDIYLAVRYTDNNQCRIGCKIYIHAHDSGRIESSDHVHVEACRSPAFPQMQNDGTYVCKPTR